MTARRASNVSINLSMRLGVAACAALVACLATTVQSFLMIPRAFCCLHSSSRHQSSTTTAPRCVSSEVRIPRVNGFMPMAAELGIGCTGDQSNEQRTVKEGQRSPEPSQLKKVPPNKVHEIFVFREEVPERVPKAIECYADRLAIVGGERYMIGHPCDWAVSICIPDGKDGVEPVPLDSDLMAEILPTLQRELEMEDVHLFETPVVLTLQGEFVEDEDDDGDDDGDDEEFTEDEETSLLKARQSVKSEATIDDGKVADFEVAEPGNGTFVDDDDDEEVQERIPTEIDDDRVQLIVTYWHDDKEYALVRHMFPQYLIARRGRTGYQLIGAEEAAVVKPQIEKMMIEEARAANMNVSTYEQNNNRQRKFNTNSAKVARTARQRHSHTEVATNATDSANLTTTALPGFIRPDDDGNTKGRTSDTESATEPPLR